MTTQPVIYFDIDRTLFDPGALMRLILQKCQEESGASAATVEQAQESYYQTLESSTDFDPEAFIPYLAEATGLQTDQIQAIFDQPQLYQAALYPEVKRVLGQLAKHFSLGIFSQGVPEWQNKKLELSGIKAFFDQEKIIIERRKSRPEIIANFNPNSTVVDDRQDFLAAIKAYDHAQTILIDRLRAKEEKLQQDDGVVYSLEGVKDIFLKDVKQV